MFHFSEGELIGEVCKCYRKECLWFWYRDILTQAEQRGMVRIKNNNENENPFWQKTFDESVEVISEKLMTVLREETSWGK